MATKGKKETGMGLKERIGKGMKPSGQSKYARKQQAKRKFLDRGGSLEGWLVKRRIGQIQIT